MLFALWGQAQKDRGAVPYSWNPSTPVSVVIPFEDVGPIDIGTVMKEDLNEASDRSLPFRFAKQIPILLGTGESGRWEQLSNGNRVWFQGVHGIEAKGIGFMFDDFFLPQGSSLHIYDENRSELLGEFNSSHNPSEGRLILPHIHSDRVVLEYFEPRSARGEGRIRIRGANYVYRTTESIERDSDPDHGCQENIRCTSLRDWHTVENSVVRISTDHGTRWGTGVLVNTTDHKQRPYVITSANNVVGPTALMNFLFEFESSDCVSQKIRPESFTVGATPVAYDESTNLVLLELDNTPNPSWGIFYAGWDRSGHKPAEVACIHHPEGDIKKCAVADGDLLGNGTLQSHNGWMVDRWELGATEKGSAGAPVFNGRGLIVGFLTAGSSTCEASKEDFVVKFRDAWDSFRTFLDPIGSSSQSHNGQSPIGRPEDERIIESEVAFYPNPASDILKIYNENDEALTGIRVFDMSQKLIGTLDPGDSMIDISRLPIGMYIIELQLETFSVKDRLVIFR